MKNFYIISSLLDNDFYKFTMQNAVIQLFPSAKAKYELINRGNHIFPKNFGKILEENLKNMETLKLSNKEKIFLEKHCPYLDSSYINFLKNYKYNAKEVNISQKGKNIYMNITGLWYRIILWEVPIMAIISELYYKLTGNYNLSDKKIEIITKKKIHEYKKCKAKIGEFGTRRRYSYKIQKKVINILLNEGFPYFIGSSNVHLSQVFSIQPIGTQGHEWIMFHAAKYGFNIADKIAMENWLKIYKGNLSIALSDTYTYPIFFKNFNFNLSNYFSGIRHDSGNPIDLIKETIKHYNIYKINPKNKKIMFSDNLNPNKVKNISSYCKNKIIPYFGIGTNFTNDFGFPAMNIVIKMIKTYIKKKWISVVKLSNTNNKSTGGEQAIKYAKKILHIE